MTWHNCSWISYVMSKTEGKGGEISETGRIRFWRVRLQTPNSVSCLALTEFRGESSVSSSQPIISVPKRAHRAFRWASPSLPSDSVRLSDSEFSSPNKYSRNSSQRNSKGATRLGATGLRGSEREICFERVSEREGFQRFSDVFRGCERLSEVFRGF